MVKPVSRTGKSSHRTKDAMLAFLAAFSKHYFVYQGSPGLIFNAGYDDVSGVFNRLNTSQPAMWVDFGFNRDIPGETNLKGVTFWFANAGANPIGDFAAADGWQGNFGITSDGTIWTRGSGLEIDRNASAPFVRVAGYVSGSDRYFGLVSNWFNDLSGVDDEDVPSWFFGLINDDFAFKRAAAGVTDFFGGSNPTLFSVTNAGTASVAGPFGAAAYTVAGVPAASSWANHHVYVTDETGGYTMAFSDGTNWRRVQDRAVIST